MKKLTPITVLEKIQPLIDNATQLAKQVKTDKYAFRLEDIDPESDFYFACNFPEKDPQAGFLVNRKPFARNTVREAGERLSLEGVTEVLKQWLDILESYNKIVTIYDDPILKSYEKEFIGFIAIDEDDADTAPLDLEKQFYLDDYLTTVAGLLEEKKSTVSEEKAKLLTEAIKECEELQEQLPELTKNQVAVKLARFWAKTRKAGIGFIKDVLTEFKKKGIEAVAKATVEHLPNLIEGISGFLG
ncbi:hypothetical protein BWI96_18925 [Siphonobacter sp. SORGH_AS_0500]|uniref:hypothetical protein n=1 Tax=Siphonobacter sp. SORGH_AS_0500 TaxID=1864824 RepID=UPI000CC1CDD9|nr:hypothetical protein [Siphonobacter sp. SORGH_AS_0500]PKK35128.1 hypothetical protein BWI96_18925 [Siphonobacter sp. SORGH_AS_0500]